MTHKDAALMLLRQVIEQYGSGGMTKSARELSVTKSAISQVLSGKYPASTKRIESRIMALYGHGGIVPCPAQGEITPAKCASTFEKARKIGMKAGNPDTLRLYKTCINCPMRKGVRK